MRGPKCNDDDATRLLVIGRALGEAPGLHRDPAFLRQLAGIAQALLSEAGRAGLPRTPSKMAQENDEAVGRILGIQTANTLSTRLALAVDGEAYTPALVEALETLVALLRGETVAHDRSMRCSMRWGRGLGLARISRPPNSRPRRRRAGQSHER